MALPRLKRRAPRTVVGLDIEPGRIVAAEVCVNGEVRLQRVAVAELPVDAVRDGEVVDADAVAGVLRQMWTEHKGLGRDVRIGVANAKIVVRTVDVPPVTDPAQIDAAVRQIAAEELTMRLDSAVLDYEPIGLVETANGPRLRVVLIAARKEMVEAVLSATAKAGLKAKGVDLSAFAMTRVLGGDRHETALYLSVGGLTNLAVVVDGNCVFTRVTGNGLEGMAIDLAERRSLTMADARTWLRRVGLKRELAEIEGDAELIADARSVLSEGTRRLANEVRASLQFHVTQSISSDVGHAVLTGAAVAIEGFAEALADELEMAVQTRSVTAVKDVAADAELPGMTIAAGLAVESVLS